MTWGELAFRRMFNGTVDIVRIDSTADAAGGPVTANTVVQAGVGACIQDHRSKLHGNQVEMWDQPVIKGHHDVFVLGSHDELGSQGNGHGVLMRKDRSTLTVFARIANVEREACPVGFVGAAPDHCLLICEEVSS